MLPRLVLILILTVALPVRGYAASIMMLCGQPAQSAVVGSLDRMVSHDHHAATDSAHEADHQHAHGDEAGDTSGSHDHHVASCSACGVCCAGVVSSLPPDVLILGTDSSGPIAFFDRHFVGFVPSGLDRPPRLLVR